MSIPRVLHFIFLDEEIPPGRQACIDSCIAQHPDYDIQIWRSLEDFGTLQNQHAFDLADEIAPTPPHGNPHQVRSNILRFEVMLRYGGVYLDTDVYALGSVEPILRQAGEEGYDGVLGWEIQDKWLGEAVIGCRPEAEFMRRIVDNLEGWALRRKRRPATVTVGPQYITPILRPLIMDSLMVVPQETFYPARHDQPDLSDGIVSGDVKSPGTVVVHLFGNLRRRQGRPL